MYATIAEVQAEMTATPPADQRITDAINLADAYIDRMTGRWFEQKTKTLKLNGNGKRQRFDLPHFPYSVTQVAVDDVTLTEGYEEEYVLENGFYPDKRNLPDITFAIAPAKGHQNIEVAGNWGYVEEDGVTPLLIKKISIKLSLVEINKLQSPDRRDVIDRGRIESETTDSHSYDLNKLIGQGGYTGDSEIDSVLIAYRRPSRMGAA